MKNLTIINEANKILQSLEKLQARCRKLTLKASAKEYIPPHVEEVLSVLDDLASFDLEDAIVNAYDYEEVK